MHTIEINKITQKDISELQNICIQTFRETFAEVNTTENIEKYVTESFAVDKLMKELSNPDTQFFFAKLEQQVIGYLKINFGQAQTELKGENSLEIERIYVLKAFHGKKVGQVLYEKALDVAKQTNANYIWLGVWEKNERALQFYKKNGFVEFDKHIFKLGADEQTDIMMKLNLEKAQ